MELLLTWEEMNHLADNIRVIRDQYIQKIPVNVFAILYRNLKVLEQELRIIQETDNFIKIACGEGTIEYFIRHQDLQELKIVVKLQEVSIEDFSDNQISPIILEYIVPFMGGAKNVDY